MLSIPITLLWALGVALLNMPRNSWFTPNKMRQEFWWSKVTLLSTQRLNHPSCNRVQTFFIFYNVRSRKPWIIWWHHRVEVGAAALVLCWIYAGHGLGFSTLVSLVLNSWWTTQGKYSICKTSVCYLLWSICSRYTSQYEIVVRIRDFVPLHERKSNEIDLLGLNIVVWKDSPN